MNARYRLNLRSKATLFSVVLIILLLPWCFAQPAIELLEKEQAAFRQAASLANDFTVQIETFGGMERVGEEFVSDGPTTGTILTEDGWIVSSLYSFRQKPASILVSLPDGTRVAAEVVARDFSRELALLKVDSPNPLPHVPADDQSASRSLSSDNVGQWIVALGKTYDKNQATQSVGIISAVGRAYGKAFQTDAKISPINYGGPVVNLDGQTLGILAPLSPGAFLEGDSSQIYDSGIGFAVPLADILDRLPKLKSGEDIHPGKLGVATSDQNEMAGPVRVVGALPGSPASKAGLKTGDVLLSADGHPIRILADLKHAIALVDAGQTLTLDVYREGQTIREIECELSQEIPVYRRRYLGLRLSEPLASASPENQKDAAEEAETANNTSSSSSALTGLLVSTIIEDTPAARSELKVGDRIVSCNSLPIRKLDDLRQILAVAELDQPLEIGLQVAEDRREIQLTPVVWPETIPSILPESKIELAENSQCKIVDIALGDFTNKAFAVIPPESEKRALGLLIVYPEPGEMDRESTQAVWEDFSKQHGWIIAVVNSADAQRWTPNEVEIVARILGRMQNSYRLDNSRIVVSGLGIGGRLAIIAANMLRDRVSGVFTIGTNLTNLRIPQKNFPLQSLDYLLVGESESLQSPQALIHELGYSVVTIETPSLSPQKWETHPMEAIHKWLEGLARF